RDHLRARVADAKQVAAKVREVVHFLEWTSPRRGSSLGSHAFCAFGLRRSAERQPPSRYNGRFANNEGSHLCRAVWEEPIQPLRLNPILNTDSYKLTHWWQYPAKTRFIYSYVCSRGGFFDHAEMAGLQYILKTNFAGKVFSPADIDE